MFNPSKKFIGVETLKAYNPSTAHRRKERDAEKKKVNNQAPTLYIVQLRKSIITRIWLCVCTRIGITVIRMFLIVSNYLLNSKVPPREECTAWADKAFADFVVAVLQNKAERKITREQALLKKNPVVIKEELDKLEEMGEQAYVAAVALLPQVQLLQLMGMQPTLTLSLLVQLLLMHHELFCV